MKTGTQLAPMGSLKGFMTVDPFRDLMELQRSVNRLFEGAGGKTQRETTLGAWTPAVDIYEDDSAYVIKAELPEVTQDDVKVSLDENTLAISGERRIENEEKREGYHRVERAYGEFYRSFTLPPNANVEAISAQFKDGVLRLSIPKKEEAKPKRIEVKVG
jgi:HSP20 family protein